MGYKITPKVYRLVFEEFEGMVVRMRSMPVRDLLAVMGQADAEDEVEGIRDSIRVLADHLVDWNLEDEDGHPLPATQESLESLEIGMVNRLTEEWMAAVTGVSGPLGSASSPGSTAMEASMPMEVMAGSLPN